jgi:hypothetical protein
MKGRATAMKEKAPRARVKVLPAIEVMRITLVKGGERSNKSIRKVKLRLRV